MIQLEGWKYAATSPMPYFRLFQNVIDVGTKRMVKTAADLTNFELLKFCAWHESSNFDFNDLTLCDIYADMTVDSGELCHLVLLTAHLVKIGQWYAIIYGKDAGGKEMYWPRSEEGCYTFFVNPKIRGNLGQL